MLHPTTPMDPFDRRDELTAGMLLVAMTLDPLARRSVEAALEDEARPPRPVRLPAPAAARHVPRRHVRPPRAC